MPVESISHLMMAAYATYLFVPLVRFHARAVGIDVSFGKFLLFVLGCIRGVFLYRGLMAALSGGDAVILSGVMDAVMVAESFANWMHLNAREYRVGRVPGAGFPELGGAMPVLLIACGLVAVVTGRFDRGTAMVVCGLAAAIAAGGVWAVTAASRKEKREREETEAARERRMREVAAAPADVAALVAFLGPEEYYGVQREAADRIVAMENGVERALELAVGLDAGMVDYMKKESHRVKMERDIEGLTADAPMERLLALYRDAAVDYFHQKIEERLLARADGAEELRQALGGEFAFEAMVLLGKLPEAEVEKRVWCEAFTVGAEMEREWRRRQAAEEKVDNFELMRLERAVAQVGEKSGRGENS